MTDYQQQALDATVARHAWLVADRVSSAAINAAARSMGSLTRRAAGSAALITTDAATDAACYTSVVMAALDAVSLADDD